MQHVPPRREGPAMKLSCAPALLPLMKGEEGWRGGKKERERERQTFESVSLPLSLPHSTLWSNEEWIFRSTLEQFRQKRADANPFRTPKKTPRRLSDC